MTAIEKLISVSNLAVCATAREHFCSIAKGGGGDIIYITRNPMQGELQKIETLIGLIQKIKISKGDIKKIKPLGGDLQMIETIKGVLNKNNNLKGNTKCQ